MTSSRTRAILASSSLFSALSLLPKILALVKDMAVAARFGASESLDAYLMAFVLIGVPVALVVVALQSTLIPALVDKSVEEAAGLLGGAVKFALLLLLLLLPAWLLILPSTLSLLYPDSPQSGRAALFEACLWLIPYYFINGANWLFYGALQARKTFWPNALLPGLFPVAILVALWLVHQADMRVLLLGTVAGSAVEGIVLYTLLRRSALLRWRHTAGSGLLRVSRLAVPLAGVGLIGAFLPLVEQLIAYRLGEGAVSLLNYGFKIPAALGSLLVTAIGVVVLPHFAELVSQQAWCLCRALYLRLCSLVLAVGLVVALLGIAFAEPLVRLLFERGAFSATHTTETADVMRMYLMQIPFLLVAMVSYRALIALDKTMTMAAISTIQFIVAGLLAYALSASIGVAGVALGMTAGSFLGAGLLVWVIWHAFNRQCDRGAPA